MIIDVGGLQIEVYASSSNFCIKAGYLVKSDSDKIDVIRRLLSYYPDYHRRNEMSLLHEWKAHNILYKWGVRPEQTRDVDLNADEPLIRRIGYFFISLLFKE